MGKGVENIELCCPQFNVRFTHADVHNVRYVTKKIGRRERLNADQSFNDNFNLPHISTDNQTHCYTLMILKTRTNSPKLVSIVYFLPENIVCLSICVQ